GKSAVMIGINARKKSAPNETRKTLHLAIGGSDGKAPAGKISQAMTGRCFSAITVCMRKIVLIGIGTGNPDHLTVAGIDAIKSADILFVPTKGGEKAQLAAIRREIVGRFAGDAPRIVEFALPVRDAGNPDDVSGVSDGHDAIAGQYREMIAAIGPEETAALLVWGDPGL